MGDTLGEVVGVLQALEAFEPIVETFVPASDPFIPLFNVAVAAAQTVSNDTGKPLAEVIQDVINHLTPGAPAAPALSPDSTVPMATLPTITPFTGTGPAST
jgi:hypothetical protein